MRCSKIFLPIMLIIITLILFFTTGCVAVVDEPAIPSGNSVSGASADNAAEIRLGNQILSSFQQNNFSEFSKALAGRMNYDVTVNDFNNSYQTIEAKMGKLKTFIFLIELQNPMVKNLVWLVTFERITSKNQTVVNQMFFRLVSSSIDNHIKVMGFGFF